MSGHKDKDTAGVNPLTASLSAQEMLAFSQSKATSEPKLRVAHFV